MRTLHICAIFLIVITFNSCEDSTITGNHDLIIVNGFLSASDTFRVNISYSTGVHSFENDSFINNAKVFLVYPDNSNHELIPDLTDYLSHLIIQNGYYRLGGLISGRQSGDYELRVEITDQKHLLAKDSIPSPVPIKSILFKKDTINKLDLFQIGFIDPSNSGNYYSVSLNTYYYINREDGLYKQQYYNLEVQSSTTYIETTLTNSMLNQLVFSDLTFNSGSEEVLLNFNSYNFSYPQFWDSVVCEVQLNSLSKSYYNYITSYFKQNQSEKDFYAEPVGVYSNIEGGYGIFAGYSTSKKRIKYSRGDISYY